MKVRAEAEVTGVEGRKLTFAVSAYDGAGRICPQAGKVPGPRSGKMENMGR